MDVKETLETILNQVNDVGYWTLPIPSKTDEEIIECILFFNKLSLDEKLNTKQGITISVARLLLYFSERMATLSLRTKNQNTFDNGLFALSMILGRLDIREITIIFSLYFDVSKRNSTSFDKVLEQKNEFAEGLSSFLNRADEDIQLEPMGYTVEVNEMKELTYKRTW